MFRRIFCPSVSYKVVAISASRLPAVAHAFPILTAHRWSSENAAADTSSSSKRTSNSSTTNRGQNNYNNRATAGRNSTSVVLPPAFDVVHWNDDDLSKGHLLRVLHRDSYVVLDYYKQAKALRPAEGIPPESNRRTGRAERIVSIALPPVFIARLLSVLEGRTNKADIQLRTSTAAFEANAEKGPHHYKLCCTFQTAGGNRAGEGETSERSNTSPLTDFEVEFDAPESLMLQRFLTQCLQYNTGFCRPVISR